MGREAVMACEPPIIRGPFSIDASKGDTHRVERTVLVVVHHLAGATRLMDIVPLVEHDQRVQMVYTVPPSSLWADGAHEFLRTTGALVMPWPQATQTRFDLALAAGQGLLEHLHAPIAMFSHGAGHISYVNRWEGHGPPASRQVSGLGFGGLSSHGRVTPSAIMLAHEDHRRSLARECPDALPTAVIAGDLCFDRLLASLPRRSAYRDALNAGPARKLVVVSSRWGAGSLLGQRIDPIFRLAAELPYEDHRVVMILHPNIWTWHGRRQVLAWFAESVRSGIILLPPEEGWRGALVAADVMIGDRGSVTSYGAALGLPVLLAPYDAEDVVPGSQFAYLGEVAPRLRTGAPLAAQLDATARDWSAGDAAVLRSRLTSAPGGAARITRRTIYRLLRLDEPAAEPVTEPVPLPCPLGSR
jgi:hypothetical protein